MFGAAEVVEIVAGRLVSLAADSMLMRIFLEEARAQTGKVGDYWGRRQHSRQKDVRGRE